MAIDGNYTVEVDSPMGKQTAKLMLKTDGSSLSGSMDSPMGGVSEFSDGMVNGDEITWSMELDSPMGKMTLEHKATVVGDEISGEVKVGNFGTMPFKGTRI